MSKKVIHKWSQKAANLRQNENMNYWGFGDQLRGSAILYEVCKKYGFEFEVDLSGHPASNCFIPQVSSFKSPSIQEDVRFESFSNVAQIEEFLVSGFKHESILCFNTNGGEVWPTRLSAECKQFIAQLLTPAPQILEYIESKGLVAEEYSVLHFRLGDEYLVKNSKRKFIKERWIASINLESTDIFITDSDLFKADFKRRFNVTTTESKPIHSGLHSEGREYIDTIIEFVIATRASRIKTYSNYSWISGFMQAVTKIYDVPLISLNEKMSTKIIKVFL